MANESLISQIIASVYPNGNNEVEAQPLQDALVAMVGGLSEYGYGGVITPDSTFTGDSESKYWYIASESGTYTNFGSNTLDNEIAIFTYSDGFTKEKLCNFYLPGLPTTPAGKYLDDSGQFSIPQLPLTPDFEEISIGTTTLRYNTERQVLEIVYDNGQVQQAGREGTTLFYNNTGSTIPNGTPLTISGAITVGNISVITVLPADAISIATAKVCGHSTLDSIDGELSIMTWKGDINGIDTSGFSQGNKLFLAVGGGYTETPPSSPNIVVELAGVLTVDATEGSIHVFFPIFAATSNTSTSTQSYLFLSNVDSSISGFKTLSKDIDAVETEKIITVNSGTSPAVGEKYLSEPLNLTVLPASILEGYGFLKADSAVGETKIDFRVSIYHEDTTTTLLVDNLSGEINNVTYAPNRFSLPFIEQALVETDRLLVEVLGITDTIGDKVINYIVGDGRAAYVALPLPIDHTTTINQNGDDNFQHLTTEQVTLVNNSVQCSASSVDNTLPRFDGTTGKLLQDSNITIDDNGVLGIIKASSQIDVENNSISIINTQSVGSGTIGSISLDNEMHYTGLGTSIASYGLQNKTYNDGTGTVTYLYGNVNRAYNQGGGVATNEIGSFNKSENTLGSFNKLLGSQSIAQNTTNDSGNNDMYGITGEVINSGTSDQVYGGLLRVNNTGTLNEVSLLHAYYEGAGGNANQVIGLELGKEHNWTGTATDAYAIYIDSSTKIGTNTNYSIYSANDADSYFAGKIGINTKSPDYLLDVKGDSLTDKIRLTNTAKSADMYLDGVGASNGDTVSNIIILNNGDSVAGIRTVVDTEITSGAIVFLTQDKGTIAERVRISKSGNFGIGTAPDEKLHVNGNIKCDAINGVYIFEGAIDISNASNNTVLLSLNSGNVDLWDVVSFRVTTVNDADTPTGAEGTLRLQGFADGVVPVNYDNTGVSFDAGYTQVYMPDTASRKTFKRDEGDIRIVVPTASVATEHTVKYRIELIKLT